MAEANLTVAKQLEAMRGSVGDDVFDASLKLVDERREGRGGRLSVYEAALDALDEDDGADPVVEAAAKARKAAGVAKTAAPAVKATAKTTR